MNVLKTLFASTEADFLQDSTEETSWTSRVDSDWKDGESDQAMVTRRISPNKLGRVKFKGTWWRAGSDRAVILEAGTPVRVIGRQRSNVLVVEPVTAALAN